MQFTFIGGEPRPKSLKDFSWEKSPFSKKFRKANTAKEFTGIWDIHVAPCLDKKTGEYMIPSSQATTAPHEASAAHQNTGSATPHKMQKRKSEVLPLELPKPKKQKQDSEEEEHKEQDKMIDDCFVGKCM